MGFVTIKMDALFSLIFFQDKLSTSTLSKYNYQLEIIALYLQRSTLLKHISVNSWKIIPTCQYYQMHRNAVNESIGYVPIILAVLLAPNKYKRVRVYTS